MGKRKKIIKFLYENKSYRWLLAIFNRIIGKNKYKIRKGNDINSTTANIFKNSFNLSQGNDNHVYIGNNSDLHNSNIIIKGSHNHVWIGENSFVNEINIVIEGDNNSVIMGENTFIFGDTRFYVVDGSSVKLGNGCMFSDRIELRTTDAHSIIDKATGKRINFEEDIILHDNVWVGTGAILLKGAEIAEGSIVGAKTVVTKKYKFSNSVIVGNPAKVVKDNVEWTMERRAN